MTSWIKGRHLQPPIRSLSVSFFFHLLLTQSCTAESQLIGPSQPIVGMVGDEVTLPCHLEPPVDVVAMTLEWTRSSLRSGFVLVWRSRQDIINVKHPSYRGRSSVSSEELQRGNISLKLSELKTSDGGTYECYIPEMEKKASVQLVVGAASSPRLMLAGLGKPSGSVELQCGSAGWYPEPEVLWLDGEGNLLPAGPTETLRGPDDLYTVSSRVTVDQRHSNNITCRVQQNNINQTRDSQIHVPDDFFMSSSADPVIIVLVVCLVLCILVILTVVVLVSKWRQNITKDQRIQENKTGPGKQKKSSGPEQRPEETPLSDGAADVDAEDPQREEVVEEQKNNQTSVSYNPYTWYQTERRRRMEAEEEVKHLKTKEEKLSAVNHQLSAELKKLKEEKQRNEDQLKKKQQEVDRRSNEVQKLTAEKQQLQKQLDDKNIEWNQINKELKEAKDQLDNQRTVIHHLQTQREEKLQEERRRLEEAEKQKKQLKTELEKLTDKVKNLEDENQRKDEDLKKLQQDLKKKQVQQLDRPGGTGHEDPPTSRNQDDPDSEGQRLTEGHIKVEVHQYGDYIRLLNKSSEEIVLGGWTLKLQIGNREPIRYKFEESFKVEAGKYVYLWKKGFGVTSPFIGSLVWKELMSWSSRDHLQIFLINDSRSIRLL